MDQMQHRYIRPKRKFILKRTVNNSDIVCTPLFIFLIVSDRNNKDKTVSGNQELYNSYLICMYYSTYILPCQ